MTATRYNGCEPRASRGFKIQGLDLLEKKKDAGRLDMAARAAKLPGCGKFCRVIYVALTIPGDAAALTATLGH
jgi:hypothetical protein